MLFKQMLVCGTRYMQFVVPNILGKKSGSSVVSNFRLCFQKNKINFINSKFCSSYDSPSEYESHHDRRNRFNSEEKIKLKKWIEMVRFQGGRIPQHISEEQYSELLSMEDEIPRLRYLHYITSKEHAKMKKISSRKGKKKERQRQWFEERNNRVRGGHIDYWLGKNTMFSKIASQDIRSLQNYRLVNAMMFNNPLVIDLDFYDHMDRREVSSLAYQVLLSIVKNRSNEVPFNLTLCNVDFDSRKFQELYKFMPSLSKPHFPMNITSKSYLDIFPNEKLIYLTPDAKDEMRHFDHSSIYIIGGLFNLQRTDPLTFAKAKKENIRMMKLPIDRYHIPKSRCDLAVHTMVYIMLELQKHGDWEKALRNIPKRLLYTSDQRHHEIYTKRGKGMNKKF